MVFHSPSPSSDTIHLLGRAEAWFDVEPALPLRLGARPWALVLLDDARCASQVSHFLACSDFDVHRLEDRDTIASLADVLVADVLSRPALLVIDSGPRSCAPDHLRTLIRELRWLVPIVVRLGHRDPATPSVGANLVAVDHDLSAAGIAAVAVRLYEQGSDSADITAVH